jgi:hypothetical protein
MIQRPKRRAEKRSAFPRLAGIADGNFQRLVLAAVGGR